MYLGIDLGTSEVKVLLLGTDHQVLAVSGAALTVQRAQPHWSEQDPADWWRATGDAVAAVRAKAPKEFAAVRAIGLSGQMHGATLLDAADRVLRPAILWNDTRSSAECAELTQRFPALPQVAGNLAMPGFTAPKLLWVAKHEPAVFAQVASVLLPKDWLRLGLTGEKVGEMSDAAGTLWLDVQRRAWSAELLAATGLTLGHMPRLVEGSSPSGTLLPAVAQAWGLPAGVIVAGGGGDNAASAVGIGAVNPGAGFLSLGTSGVMFVVTDRYRPNPASAVHAFCHAVPGRWHQMSVTLSAASSLAWVTKLLRADGEAALLLQAEALSDAERDAAPIFLPYLSGERTPHNDASAQGLFFGLNHDTDAARLAWAVIEGVAFSMCDGLAALQAAGTTVGPLSLVGGGSRSALWGQLLASALSLELRVPDGGAAGGALGAARLAWLADGGSEAEVCGTPATLKTFVPQAAEHARLAPRCARYRALYPATSALNAH
jgi:xylulokinase